MTVLSQITSPQNSHAVVYADGLAKAFALHGSTDRRVVAIVGDGALTGGMCWEALNNIGAPRIDPSSSCSTTTDAPTHQPSAASRDTWPPRQRRARHSSKTSG
jgi:transketolase N-terminal domain/subunit